MRILVIDNVNYADYPTGGIMNFYRNSLPAFGNDLLLAGITTDGTGEVGKWEKREMNGCRVGSFSANWKASRRQRGGERLRCGPHTGKHRPQMTPASGQCNNRKESSSFLLRL